MTTTTSSSSSNNNSSYSIKFSTQHERGKHALVNKPLACRPVEFGQSVPVPVAGVCPHRWSRGLQPVGSESILSMLSHSLSIGKHTHTRERRDRFAPVATRPSHRRPTDVRQVAPLSRFGCRGSRENAECVAQSWPEFSSRLLGTAS